MLFIINPKNRKTQLLYKIMTVFPDSPKTLRTPPKLLAPLLKMGFISNYCLSISCFRGIYFFDAPFCIICELTTPTSFFGASQKVFRPRNSFNSILFRRKLCRTDALDLRISNFRSKILIFGPSARLPTIPILGPKKILNSGLRPDCDWYFRT